MLTLDASVQSLDASWRSRSKRVHWTFANFEDADMHTQW